MNAKTETGQVETLASAMAAAFVEIEAATKSATNPHFKSKYADLGAVIDAIKPALIKHGLYFTQHPEPSEDGVCIETVLRHEGGETLSMGRLYLPANKRDAQGFGSALTYARRYALQTAFGVPTEDDDGNAAVKTVANDANGKAEKRDAPFAPGPARNKTDLKEKGRKFWNDVVDCDDGRALETLVKDNRELTSQIAKELPLWWSGGTHENGEPYEGLGAIIVRKQLELSVAAEDDGGDGEWRNNPLTAG